jgi:hydrogenase nickel incorporation protein HypA/HybF
MHELSLMADLMRKIGSIAREQRASRIVSVKVKLGALSHISPAHFHDHFLHAARGSLAEGARLDIEVLSNPADPHAQEILLDSIEVESDD